MTQPGHTDIESHVADNMAGLAHAFCTSAGQVADVLNELVELDRTAMERFWTTRNRLLAELIAQVPQRTTATWGKTPECSAGCTACCYQHIIITSTEAFHIALSLAERPGISATLAWQAKAVHGLSHVERYERRIPCGFLQDGLCSIYDHRPQTCRTYFSMSRQACDRDEPVPLVADAQSWGAIIEMGCDYALLMASTGGLQILRGEMGAMLAIATRPGAFEAWLEGEHVFPDDIFRPSTREGSLSYREVLLAAAVQLGAHPTAGTVIDANE